MEHQPSTKKGKTLISLFFKKRDRQTNESNSIPTVITAQHQYSETLLIPTIQIPSISSSQNEYHSSLNSICNHLLVSNEIQEKKTNM